jgi:hypothetical protein
MVHTQRDPKALIVASTSANPRVGLLILEDQRRQFRICANFSTQREIVIPFNAGRILKAKRLQDDRLGPLGYMIDVPKDGSV